MNSAYVHVFHNSKFFEHESKFFEHDHKSNSKYEECTVLLKSLPKSLPLSKVLTCQIKSFFESLTK